MGKALCEKFLIRKLIKWLKGDHGVGVRRSQEAESINSRQIKSKTRLIRALQGCLLTFWVFTLTCQLTCRSWSEFVAFGVIQDEKHFHNLFQTNGDRKVLLNIILYINKSILAKLKATDIDASINVWHVLNPTKPPINNTGRFSFGL